MLETGNFCPVDFAPGAAVYSSLLRTELLPSPGEMLSPVAGSCIQKGLSYILNAYIFVMSFGNA